MVQLSYPYMTAGKTIALTIWTFVSEVMSLLLNVLWRFLIAFLPRNKHLLISWLHSPSVMILEPKKIKSLTVCIVSSSICVNWWDQMPWSLFFECWDLSQLFHSPFSFIKRLFSSSLLSAVKVISSAYLRLLIFLQAVLIPACDSSSPIFHTMYSAYNLTK